MGLLQKLLGRDRGAELPPPSYSNAAVIARIEKEHGVDSATAKAWFVEMLIFLDLCARSDEMLSPPPDVDAAWHAFLLHSRDYEAYCNERFGRVIHHQPTGEPDPEAYRRAYEQRREYASATTPDPVLWAVPVGVTAASEEEEEDQQPAGGGGAGVPVGSGDDRGRDEPEPSHDADGFGGEASGDSIGSPDSGSAGGDSGGGSSCGGGASCGGGGS